MVYLYTVVYYRSPEVQVMDYQTQQFKLLPLIASSYALILTGQYMLRIHMQSRAEIADGNLESLPEVHCMWYADLCRTFS